MASVVISGDTSGAATISAPAVAGTPTLTLPTTTDTLVGKATTDTLTNKTLTTPVISTISNTGTITLPTSTDTLVGRATTDTLTNKTLTSPTIATPTMTGQATIPTINLTGGQITFPATQSASSDANTLDDYEEGTFSPTVVGTTSGSATYTTQNGIYVKVGGWVFVQIALDFNKSTISGNLRIANLPFTSKSGINYSTSCGYWSGWATAILTPTSFLGGNSTFFQLRKLTAASTNTNTSLSDADINASGNEIMFNVFYPVA